MDEKRSCRTCKHRFRNAMNDVFCGHPNAAMHDRIRGEVYPVVGTVVYDNRKCGTEAKWWEPSIWRRILSQSA
jgi:hypothetical protein